MIRNVYLLDIAKINSNFIFNIHLVMNSLISEKILKSKEDNYWYTVVLHASILLICRFYPRSGSGGQCLELQL